MTEFNQRREHRAIELSMSDETDVPASIHDAIVKIQLYDRYS